MEGLGCGVWKHCMDSLLQRQPVQYWIKQMCFERLFSGNHAFALPSVR